MIQPCRDFIIHPSPSPSAYHIFFLPGNPGLVEYYAGFLSLLHESLNHTPSTQLNENSQSTKPTIKFNVAGCSFAGFEAENPHDDNNDGANPTGHRLYSISEQVDFSLDRLRAYITENSQATMTTATKQKVILVGHSFGTFVIAEMMKQIFNNKTSNEGGFNDNFEIIGSILLFPPLPDLEKSPRGQKIATIVGWKHLPSVASYMAKLVYKLPLNWCNAVIRYLTAFPSDALHTTRTFFGSRTGVAQALYMANLEFEAIKLSRWEAAFRAVVAAAAAAVSSDKKKEKEEDEADKVYIRLFFGKNDHWVRNDLRDAFIYKYCDDGGPRSFDSRREYLDIRARIDPSVDGDEGSVVIPHDFSIRHSEHVVPYVVEYVEEIVGTSLA